jgi:hypothetical protein
MRSWSNTEICKSSTTERFWIHAAYLVHGMNLGERREPEIRQESLDFPLHPF